MSGDVPFPPVNASLDEVPVPDWHMKILAERLAKYSDGAGGLNTDGWTTWEEFEEELIKSLTK